MAETLEEYKSMVEHPWKVLFFNFLLGVARGLGLAVGMTIIAAVTIYLVSKMLVRMVDVPVIGAYIAELIKVVNMYSRPGALPR